MKTIIGFLLLLFSVVPVKAQSYPFISPRFRFSVVVPAGASAMTGENLSPETTLFHCRIVMNEAPVWDGVTTVFTLHTPEIAEIDKGNVFAVMHDFLDMSSDSMGTPFTNRKDTSVGELPAIEFEYRYSNSGGIKFHVHGKLICSRKTGFLYEVLGISPYPEQESTSQNFVDSFAALR